MNTELLEALTILEKEKDISNQWTDEYGHLAGYLSL